MAEPIGTGLIASLAHPGGNVTGLTTANTEIAAKRMQLLQEFVGGASPVGLLFNPEDASNLIFLKNAELGARGLGVAVRVFEAVDQRGIAAAFSRMEDERLDALMVAAGQLMDFGGEAHHRPGSEIPTSGHLWGARVRRGRWPHVVLGELHRQFPQSGCLRR